MKSYARVVARIDIVEWEEREQAQLTYKTLLIERKQPTRGGIPFLRDALRDALSPTRAQQILNRFLNLESSGFNLLKHVDPAEIVPFLSKEHPQTIALILSQLETEQSAAILSDLSLELQSEVTIRIASMDTLAPQTLRDLERSLATDLENVLRALEAADSELAEEVRNEMFVFEDLATLTDRELQAALKEVDLQSLAVAIQDANQDVVERI
jgi:flagellar motor switch protein FliG